MLPVDDDRQSLLLADTHLIAALARRLSNEESFTDKVKTNAVAITAKPENKIALKFVFIIIKIFD